MLGIHKSRFTAAKSKYKCMLKQSITLGASLVIVWLEGSSQ